MPQPIIRKTGSSSGVGTAGEDSNDLVPSEVIQLEDTEAGNVGASYKWFMDEQPEGAGVTLINPTSPTPSFIVPADAETHAGTFVVRCQANVTYESTLRLSLPLPVTGGRIAAFEEELEWNAGSNTKGWHPAKAHLFRQIDRRLPSIVSGGFSWGKAGGTPPTALSDDGAGNFATDASLSNVFTLTLTQASILENPTNLQEGFNYAWIVAQDATGGWTLGYGGLFKWPAGTAPTVNADANGISLITALYVGGVLLANSEVQGYA